MVPYPAHQEIDYAKFAPDLPEDQLEAKYGLPREVRFCKSCVMSNQKPNSCYEFEHTIHSVKKSMHIREDGICDACIACANKEGKIDWEDRERQLKELCDRYRRTDGSYDCLVPGSGGKDSFYAAQDVYKRQMCGSWTTAMRWISICPASRRMRSGLT